MWSKAIENTSNAFTYSTRSIKFLLKKLTIFHKILFTLVSQFTWSLVLTFSYRRFGTLLQWSECTLREEESNLISPSQLFWQKEEAASKCTIALCKFISLCWKTLLQRKSGEGAANSHQWGVDSSTSLPMRMWSWSWKKLLKSKLSQKKESKHLELGWTKDDIDLILKDIKSG